VCECGEPDCAEHLLLPPVLYDSLKQNDVALFVVSGLAWSLTDPVEISEGLDGVELTVEITTTLAETLSHVRNWARRYGLASIDVNVHGETKTLVS